MYRIITKPLTLRITDYLYSRKMKFGAHYKALLVVLLLFTLQRGDAQDPLYISNRNIEIDTFIFTYETWTEGRFSVFGQTSFFVQNVTDSPIIIHWLKWSNSSFFVDCRDRYGPIPPGKILSCKVKYNCHGSWGHRNSLSANFGISQHSPTHFKVASHLPAYPVLVVSDKDSLVLKNVSKDTLKLWPAPQPNTWDIPIELWPGEIWTIHPTAGAPLVYECLYQEKVLTYKFEF